MALSNTTNRVQTAALSGVSGGDTIATFNSRISADADLKVYEVTTSATTLLTLNSDYTLSKVLSGSLITSASVVASTSAVDAGKFADDSVIVVIRETDYKQSSDYEPNAIIPADTLENDLDKLAMQTQQLKDDLTRSLRFSSTLTDAPDPNITLTAAERANKILGFSADGSEFAVTQEIGNYRSNWATGIVYSVRDIVKQASGSDASTLNNIYICNTSHTASGSYLTQFDSANWDLIVDAAAAASSASSASASASAAADDAADAEKLATHAEDTQYTLSDGVTGYSALHYSAKAQAAKTDAETAEANAATAQGLAEDAQAAAEGALATIQGFYLGAQASDPTVDGNGNAVTSGDWYFNTSSNTTRIYNGTSWNVIEALPQGLDTTDSPTFAGLDVTGTLTLGTALTADALARTPNWISAEQQLTGGNDVAAGFYSGSSTLAERRTINIPAMQLRINATVYTLSSATTLDADSSGSWASGETTYATAANRAGKDLYVYAVEPSSGTTPNFCLSANSSYPSGTVGGVTAGPSNSRKIGGFHCLCAAVGTISGHSLTGYLAGDILPRSVWTQHTHRPESNPEGMVFVGNRLWADIYLASNTTNLESSNGGTIVDGASDPDYHWYNFAERFAEINKRLPTQAEFMALAIGSNEETNINGSADPVTTGGHSDTAGRRMISNIGCEDCCGAMWQWINETGGQNAGASWAVQDTAGDATTYDGANSIGRGQGYAVPTRGIVGGGWDSGAIYGSRGVYWNASPLVLSGNFGARGVSGSLY
jgi:hypothetical protein